MPQRLARNAAEPAPEPLQDFQQFPDLPIELRYRIWRFAALTAEPRVIHLEINDPVRPHYNIRASAAPTLLSVNQEARSEILKLNLYI